MSHNSEDLYNLPLSDTNRALTRGNDKISRTVVFSYVQLIDVSSCVPRKACYSSVRRRNIKNKVQTRLGSLIARYNLVGFNYVESVCYESV
jgi:hypothetical protein